MKYVTTRYLKIVLATIIFGFVGQVNNGHTQTIGSLYNNQQNDVNELNIEKGTDLKQALERLEQQFNVVFLYRFGIVKDISVQQSLILPKNIDKALKTLLSSTELEFKYLNPKTYGIFEKPKEFPAIQPSSFLQDIQIQGTVVDAETGQPLPGVNIVVQGAGEETGSMIGTSTNMEGYYEIEVPDEYNILVFSSIGYETEEIAIDGRTEINVELGANIQMLSDLVVVGFGQQQRVENLTGSVSSINSSTIEDRPLTQSSQSLAGQVSGVTVLQSSGNPGEDQATINIRGLNTFSDAGNAPLILVDGIAADIDDVNPSDIANVSILKDAASAAIYGSRGANGVILIETKKGQAGALQADYNSYYGWVQPTELLELVDAATYAEMQNEALNNQGQNPAWSQEEIQKFRTGSDPENYPDLNQYKLLMDSTTPIQTNHDLRFSGGDELNRYFFSIGYLKKEGLMLNNTYNRYNARLNLDSDITDKLSVRLNLSGHQADHSQLASPGNQGRNDPNGWIQTSVKVPPTVGGQRSDGSYGRLADFTIPGWIASDSERDLTEQYLLGSVQLDYDIIENLNVRGIASYRTKETDISLFEGTVQLDEAVTLGPSELTESTAEENLLTLQALLEYYQDVNLHSIRILGGYSQEEFNNKFVQAYRDNFPNNNLRELDAGDAGNQQASGTSGNWAIQSVFGRLNYSFDNRYLFESNVRYDGSSRFPEDNRYGLFPSASIGWRISEEGFFNINWMDELKVRASYGQIGNQEIGLYPYQLTLNLGNNYVFGDSFVPGAAAELLPNRDITWETTTTLDFGLDLELFENRLKATIDYFDKDTEDILFGISSSAVLGLTPAEQNAGSVNNKGWEISLEYRDTIGEFFFSIIPNFSVVNNEVTSLANVEEDIGQGLFVGHPVQSIYGFKADGLFVDQNDIDQWADMPFDVKPGDIRLKDLNGDGAITFEGDRKIIGNRFPKYNFGATINGGYKSLDFKIQFHGVAGINEVHNSGEAFRAFFLGTTPQKWQIENRFRLDDPSRGAKYPRLEIVNAGDRNGLVSTYWLRDAWFVRVRDITLGYTLPQDLTNKIGLRQARIYLNGNNLFTFDDFFPGWEPEMNGFYPLTKSFNLGLNVQI